MLYDLHHHGRVRLLGGLLHGLHGQRHLLAVLHVLHALRQIIHIVVAIRGVQCYRALSCSCLIRADDNFSYDTIIFGINADSRDRENDFTKTIAGNE